LLLDPTDQFIHNLSRVVDLNNTVLLEIGCGSGRITQELALRAREVVAVDPDDNALRQARTVVHQKNVTFVHTSAEVLDIPWHAFDAAIFSLSLHHVAREAMDVSLQKAAARVLSSGCIVVIEPGDQGTLLEAEMNFDVGDGDERGPKAAAQQAIFRLAGWKVGETTTFRTLFHFKDIDDFLDNLPARKGQRAPIKR
jgi:ubiquinone/menaquinone biosynthesis C-methylase UbiE